MPEDKRNWPKQNVFNIPFEMYVKFTVKLSSLIAFIM